MALTQGHVPNRPFAVVRTARLPAVEGTGPSSEDPWGAGNEHPASLAAPQWRGRGEVRCGKVLATMTGGWTEGGWTDGTREDTEARAGPGHSSLPASPAVSNPVQVEEALAPRPPSPRPHASGCFHDRIHRLEVTALKSNVKYFLDHVIPALVAELSHVALAPFPSGCLCPSGATGTGWSCAQRSRVNTLSWHQLGDSGSGLSVHWPPP